MKKQICTLTEKLTLLSPYPRYKIGCIITDKKHNVLSLGVNSLKTHPLQYKLHKKLGNPKRIYLHAEVSAIVRIRSGIPFFLYVARTSIKDGRLMLAKPCLGCYSLIQETGIRKIHYSCQDSWESIDVS